MNYEVIPGKEQAFEDAFTKVLNVMKDMQGHEKSHLYKDVAKATSYLIVSEWSEKEAFSKFIQSEEFAAVTNWGKEQILAGRPSHKVYANA